MAYIRSFTENLQAIRGETPGPETITLPGSAPSTGGSSPAPQPNIQQTTTSAPAAPLGGPAPAATPLTPGRSLDRTASDLSRLGSTLSGLGESFRQEAGPSRSFGDLERSQLEAAIRDPSAVEAARGLLSAQYQGPAGLDQEKVGDLQHEASQLANYLATISQKRGLSSYMLGATPGLTPGEARFEARDLARDQGFLSGARSQAREAGQLSRQIGREAESAEAFAKQRAEEEAALREAAQSFVRGRGEELRGGVEARAAETNAAQRALEEAFGEFSRTGDLSKLEPFGDVSGFQTNLRLREQEAESMRKALDEKYKDLAHIGPANLMVYDKGRERRVVNIDGKIYSIDHLFGGQEQVAGMSREESMALGKRLKERQDEYDRLFSPKRNLLEYQHQRGAYGDIAPLYYGTEFAGPDVRNFAMLDPGTQATLENMATAEEIEQLNRIADLLGSPGRITGSTYDPRELILDPDSFRAEESARYQDHISRLSERERLWNQAVVDAQKARRRDRLFGIL